MIQGRVLIVVGGIMVPLAHAVAQELPRYDVASYCDEIAGLGGQSSEMMKEACFDEEQASYDATKPTWNELPAAVRRYCRKIAEIGGHGSYMMLKACIDEELSAKKSNEGRQFKY